MSHNQCHKISYNVTQSVSQDVLRCHTISVTRCPTMSHNQCHKMFYDVTQSALQMDDVTQSVLEDVTQTVLLLQDNILRCQTISVTKN